MARRVERGSTAGSICTLFSVISLPIFRHTRSLTSSPHCECVCVGKSPIETFFHFVRPRTNERTDEREGKETDDKSTRARKGEEEDEGIFTALTPDTRTGSRPLPRSERGGGGGRRRNESPLLLLLLRRRASERARGQKRPLDIFAHLLRKKEWDREEEEKRRRKGH